MIYRTYPLANKLVATMCFLSLSVRVSTLSISEFRCAIFCCISGLRCRGFSDPPSCKLLERTCPMTLNGKQAMFTAQHFYRHHMHFFYSILFTSQLWRVNLFDRSFSPLYKANQKNKRLINRLRHLKYNIN